MEYIYYILSYHQFSILYLGGELKIDYSKYENYFNNTEEYQILEKKLSSASNKSIKDTYTKEFEKKIKKDLEEMNIDLQSLSLNINLETGELESLKLNVKKSKEQKETNSIQVNKIEISNSNISSSLSKKEINDLKNTLQEKYNIEYEKISINSI